MQEFSCSSMSAFPQFADGDLQEAEDTADLAMNFYESVSDRRVCIV